MYNTAVFMLKVRMGLEPQYVCDPNRDHLHVTG